MIWRTCPIHRPSQPAGRQLGGWHLWRQPWSCGDASEDGKDQLQEEGVGWMVLPAVVDQGNISLYKINSKNLSEFFLGGYFDKQQQQPQKMGIYYLAVDKLPSEGVEIAPKWSLVCNGCHISQGHVWNPVYSWNPVISFVKPNYQKHICAASQKRRLHIVHSHCTLHIFIPNFHYTLHILPLPSRDEEFLDTSLHGMLCTRK